MKNIFIIIAFLVSFLEASQIEWHKSYEDVIKTSAEDQKMIMLFITGEDCKFCAKLKDETFKDPDIIQEITNKYHCVEVTKDEDTYPKKFTAKGVPTIYFLTPKQEVIDYTLGYYDAEEFGYILSAAQRRYKKIKDTK